MKLKGIKLQSDIGTAFASISQCELHNLMHRVGNDKLKQIRKLLVTIIGCCLLFVGLLMILLPGPALIIIPIALVILNAQYPDKVRASIRKFQRGLSKAAIWLDKKLKQWSQD